MAEIFIETSLCGFDQGLAHLKELEDITQNYKLSFHGAMGKSRKEARESQGVSLRDLARKMDIPTSYLDDLEKGQRPWDRERMSKSLHSLQAIIDERADNKL